jgi:hypothetical protein
VAISQLEAVFRRIVIPAHRLRAGAPVTSPALLSDSYLIIASAALAQATAPPGVLPLWLDLYGRTYVSRVSTSGSSPQRRSYTIKRDEEDRGSEKTTPFCGVSNA